jgi:hypothetical protein
MSAYNGYTPEDEIITPEQAKYLTSRNKDHWNSLSRHRFRYLMKRIKVSAEEGAPSLWIPYNSYKTWDDEVLQMIKDLGYRTEEKTYCDKDGKPLLNYEGKEEFCLEIFWD